MPYIKEWAVRINEPDKYERFASKDLGDGIRIIIGFKKEGGSEVQAYRFDKEKWDEKKIKNWLEEHKIEYKEIEKPKEVEKMELENTKDLQDILIFPKGKFFIQHLKETIEFNEEFFNEILDSFKDEKLVKPFIDKNHEKKESFGDVIELYVAEDGMHAKVQLNDNGIELIKGREYRYISPWFGSFTDTEGKEHKWVLFSISLTNIPALSGALPELQEQMQLEMMSKTNIAFEKMLTIAKQKGWISLQDEEKDFDTRVAELLEALYNQLLTLSDTASQVDTLLKEKEVLQEKVSQQEKQINEMNQKQLEKEADEVIKQAIEQGQYHISLYEFKRQQYIQDKQMILKELSLIPKKQNVKGQAVRIELQEEDVKAMKLAGLDPQNLEDVKLYKQANKIN